MRKASYLFRLLAMILALTLFTFAMVSCEDTDDETVQDDPDKNPDKEDPDKNSEPDLDTMTALELLEYALAIEEEGSGKNFNKSIISDCLESEITFVQQPGFVLNSTTTIERTELVCGNDAYKKESTTTTYVGSGAVDEVAESEYWYVDGVCYQNVNGVKTKKSMTKQEFSALTGISFANSSEEDDFLPDGLKSILQGCDITKKDGVYSFEFPITPVTMPGMYLAGQTVENGKVTISIDINGMVKSNMICEISFEMSDQTTLQRTRQQSNVTSLVTDETVTLPQDAASYVEIN